MKNYIYLIITLLLFNSCKEKENKYIAQSKKSQYELNVHYANKETSPLTEKDFISFSTLDFYKIDTSFVIKSSFKRTPKAIPFDMLTTTSRLAKYVQYGVLTFDYKNNSHSLAVYQTADPKSKEEQEDLFIPFTDNSNGKTSYAGGRYLDIKVNELKDIDNVHLNFNKNYNPYCAYNKKYSCPIPPKDNHLNFEVNAGVKKFH